MQNGLTACLISDKSDIKARLDSTSDADTESGSDSEGISDVESESSVRARDEEDDDAKQKRSSGAEQKMVSFMGSPVQLDKQIIYLHTQSIKYFLTLLNKKPSIFRFSVNFKNC